MEEAELMALDPIVFTENIVKILLRCQFTA
jgi:hypothetical protein